MLKIYLNVKELYNQTKDRDKFVMQLGDFNIKIEKNIIDLLTNNDIKKDSVKVYFNICKQKLNIITYEDKNAFKIFNDMGEKAPFCILLKGDINLNTKNAYIYYRDYFTKFAQTLVRYFSKIIIDCKCNVVSEYKNKDIEFLYIKSIDIFNIDKISEDNCIILPNYKYFNDFFINFIDILIIVEARYDKDIVELTNLMLDIGKSICVVPSNIFRKNSYFSNYLIKQGADIILNRQDLKFILNNIMS